MPEPASLTALTLELPGTGQATRLRLWQPPAPNPLSDDRVLTFAPLLSFSDLITPCLSVSHQVPLSPPYCPLPPILSVSACPHFCTAWWQGSAMVARLKTSSGEEPTWGTDFLQSFEWMHELVWVRLGDTHRCITHTYACT